MIFRMELTYHEVAEILYLKHIDAKSTGYTFPPEICEAFDFNVMLKFLLPDYVKVNITIDDIRLISILTTNKTFRLTKVSFFYVILGIIESHSGLSGDIEGFFSFDSRYL